MENQLILLYENTKREMKYIPNNFQQLYDYFFKSFEINQKKEYVFYYEDSEGEKTLIANDEDLKSLLEEKNPKIYIKIKNDDEDDEKTSYIFFKDSLNNTNEKNNENDNDKLYKNTGETIDKENQTKEISPSPVYNNKVMENPYKKERDDKEILKKDEEIKQLKEQLNSIKIENEKLTKNNEEFKNRNKKLINEKKKLINENNEIKEIKEKNAIFIEEKNSFEKEKKDLNEQIKKKENEIQELKNKYNESQNIIKDLEKKYNEIKIELKNQKESEEINQELLIDAKESKGKMNNLQKKYESEIKIMKIELHKKYENLIQESLNNLYNRLIEKLETRNEKFIKSYKEKMMEKKNK